MKPNEHQEMILALAYIMCVDASLNAAKLARTARDLRKAGYTPNQVIKCYDPNDKSSWWRKHDWRGKRGEFPNIASVRETIQRAVKSKRKSWYEGYESFVNR